MSLALKAAMEKSTASHALLRTRDSTMLLLALDKSGAMDARSEMGTVIKLEEWAAKPNTQYSCKCFHVKDNEQLIQSHLLLTDTHMYILRPTAKADEYVIKVRRKLRTIMRITTKANLPEVVKIQYGSKGAEGTHITDTDRLHIPKKAGTVIKTIKTILQAR